MSSSSELEALSALAARLARVAPAVMRRQRTVPRLPPMLILTDPRRTSDPLALAEGLPPSAGLVYRAFGAEEAAKTAAALGHIARRRGLVLLIGADASLAQACGANGIHLPERRMGEAPRLRARWPRALITCAAHSHRALHLAAKTGLDAALLSTIFSSFSPSAGCPIGPLRLARSVIGLNLPVYALGGVDGQTARRLLGTGVAGVAAVGAGARALTPRESTPAPRRGLCGSREKLF